MAKRRALGRALTGFSQNFLPAWQSMQYMDRLNEREERMRRRDARGDLESMRTQVRTDFTPESEIPGMVDRFMRTNPETDFTADDVTKALMSALPSTPERFQQMTADLTQEQVAAMPPSEIEARAASAGFPMDQWNTTGLDSIAFGGAPPGAAPQATPGRLPDEIVSALDGSLGDVQRDAPNLMGPIQRPKPAIPWLSKIEQTGDPSLADQFRDLQEQYGAWGEEIAGLAEQRELEALANQQRQAGEIAEEIAQGNFGPEMSRRLILMKVENAAQLNFFLAQEEARNKMDRANILWGVTDPEYVQAVYGVQEDLAVMRSRVNGIGQIINRLDNEGNPLTFEVRWNPETRMREYVDLSDAIPGRPFSEAALQYETDPINRRIRDYMAGGADISNPGDRSKMVESLVEEELATPEAARERVERLGGRFNGSGQTVPGEDPVADQKTVEDVFGSGAVVDAPETSGEALDVYIRGTLIPELLSQLSPLQDNLGTLDPTSPEFVARSNRFNALREEIAQLHDALRGNKELRKDLAFRHRMRIPR